MDHSSRPHYEKQRRQKHHSEQKQKNRRETQQENRHDMERDGELVHYTPLSTEYNYLHSRMKEEFPDGPYGSELDNELGKQSGWDTGEEVAPQFSYENEHLHEDTQRMTPQRDPIRKHPEGRLD